MKKAPLSIRNILLLTIGTLSFLVAIFTLQQVYQEGTRLENFRELKDATALGDRLFDAIEKLAVERDTAFFILHAADDDIRESLTQNLKEARGGVDKSLDAALKDISQYGFSAAARASLGKWRDIQQFRADVDRMAALPPEKRDPKVSAKWFADTSALIADLRTLWGDFSSQFDNIDTRVTLQSRFKYYLGSITEDAGRERALIGRFLVENTVPTAEEQSQLLRSQGRMEQSWQTSEALARQSGVMVTVAPALKDAQSHYLNLYDMMRELFYTPGAIAQPPYPISPELWLELATEATDSLYALKDAALQSSQRYIAEQEGNARNSIFLRLAALVFSLSLCMFSFRVVTKRVLQPIHDISEALIRTSQGQEVEQVTIAVERQDEIGKLAQVLRSFQGTMVDLRRYTRDLERSNKELDDFAYIASHDLKEPLRGISNHSRFLLDDNQDKLDKDSISRISRLIFLSQRIEKLINDLLYFSRLGRQELAIQEVDPNAMVRDVESTLVEFLKSHNAVITIPTPMPHVTCDAVRVMEVFRNLIVNGIKYNDSPQKIIEIGWLDNHAGPNGKLAHDVFYVKDNGHGILPEFHQEIFRIFRRIEKAQQNKDDGNGVGLTFVKKIVEKHGGTIWLESEPGNGTTFYFTLKEGASNDRRAAA